MGAVKRMFITETVAFTWRGKLLPKSIRFILSKWVSCFWATKFVSSSPLTYKEKNVEFSKYEKFKNLRHWNPLHVITKNGCHVIKLTKIGPKNIFIRKRFFFFNILFNVVSFSTSIKRPQGVSMFWTLKVIFLINWFFEA